MMGMVSVAPLPTVGDLSALASLLELLRHPDKAREAVAHLLQAAERSEKAAAQVREEQRKLEVDRAAHHAAITKERAEHDAQMSRERAQWNSERSARLAEIERMEVQAREALDKAEKAEKSATARDRDLQARLKKLSELAA
jgi:hypothetical protein